MSIRSVRTFLALAVVGFAVFSGVRTIDAHHAVLRFNLEEMTVTAERIFVGRCISVEETEEMIAQGMMPVTRYTFEVERALKGELPQVVTFTQLGHPARRAVGKGGVPSKAKAVLTPASLFHGTREYKVGERSVLFLIKEYSDGKVTRPVGLYQGVFEISRMPSGKELVRNSINNNGLFTAPYNGTRMSESDARIIFPERDSASEDRSNASLQNESLMSKRGALPLDDFLGFVERVVEVHGGRRGVIVKGTGKGAVQQ
ncbi:MAG TPA: hypothetical protein VKC34_00550 [Blastocatellia bacterium]|nr:hypothetical protein [Blastocatellia bacterium]